MCSTGLCAADYAGGATETTNSQANAVRQCNLDVRRLSRRTKDANSITHDAEKQRNA